jgi:diaminohydroxyphosphoribosylaminopyrimidine deaminase/5-amino-6-(5-phosphoribosylamino)uracil reductase
MMRRALELAALGMNTTTPNPRVGCVVAKGDALLGEGWHERAGGAHAEVRALEGISAENTTLYVSMEPCNHHGRTPPCVDLILQKKVGRVVAAMLDPNPQAARGGTRLAAAGVRFEHGLMAEEARELNIGFVSRVARGRPWVRLKIAATLDGRTALASGESRWITGAEARKDGHRWRARACAILTGAGTVRADDPQLTVRDVPATRQPLRVIADSHLETPPGARILQGDKVLIFSSTEEKQIKNAEIVKLANSQGKVDLPGMLKELARRGINELHVEAGFKLNGSLLREGCVDELLLYLNPSLLGDTAHGMVNLAGVTALDQRVKLKIHSVEKVGDDLRILART